VVHLRQLLRGEPSEVEVLADRARSLSGIGSIVWLLTYGCNLRCLHCYERGRSSDELSVEDSLRIMDKLEKAGRPLIFVSGGEPLVRREVLRMLEDLRARGFGVILSTNGTLIDRSVAERLPDLVKNVAIPLYGPEELHDAITRVKGSHGKVIESLRMLKGSVGLTLKTIASRRTVKHLDYLLGLISRYEVTTLYLCDLIPNPGMGDALSDAEWRKLMDELIRVLLDMDIEIDLGLHPSAAVYMMLKLGYAFPEIARRLSGRRLAREGYYIAIAPNGDALVSSYTPDLRLGNILKDELSDLVRKELFVRLRSSENLRGRCSRCPLRDSCGGSRVKAYLHSGDVLGEDPTCLVRDMVA